MGSGLVRRHDDRELSGRTGYAASSRELICRAQIADLTMEEMTPPVIPLLLATLVALAVIVLFPGLSTFLPTLWGL